MNLDKELINLASGDKQAFDNIYAATSKGIFHTILSYTNNNYGLSQDIMQEAYITIFKKACMYKSGTNANAWLYTIAKNTALNSYAKNKKHNAFDLEIIAELEDKDASIDRQLDSPLLDLAFKVLKTNEYQVLMLTEVDGYKRREVATMLDIPIGTVTWLHNEALKKLKTEWRARVDEE